MIRIEAVSSPLSAAIGGKGRRLRPRGKKVLNGLA
jgi:hypothetical protein